MVNSQLNPTINYIEKKDVARNDYDLESDIWNIEVGDNTEMYITIGNLNHWKCSSSEMYAIGIVGTVSF